MSGRQTVSGFRLAGASVLLVSYAQLAQKWGMARLPPVDTWATQITAHPMLHVWPLVVVGSGLVAYFVSMLCWLGALDTLALNRAYPILGLSYGLVYLGSVWLPWYHEHLSAQAFVGVGMIFIGVTLINLRRARE